VNPRIERAREAWRELGATIRSEPIADARKLVDEMLVDLDGLFALPAPRARSKR
jgi:hypothetical protein